MFGTWRETSDLIVDCLELWRQEPKSLHGDIRELVIHLDDDTQRPRTGEQPDTIHQADH